MGHTTFPNRVLCTVSVCPATILVFILLGYNNGRTHRDGTLLLKVHKVISQKLRQKKNFIDTSEDIIFDETIESRSSREMTSHKIHQYLTLTCKTPMPKLLFLIKSLRQI